MGKVEQESEAFLVLDLDEQEKDSKEVVLVNRTHSSIKKNQQRNPHNDKNEINEATKNQGLSTSAKGEGGEIFLSFLTGFLYFFAWLSIVHFLVFVYQCWLFLISVGFGSGHA